MFDIDFYQNAFTLKTAPEQGVKPNPSKKFLQAYLETCRNKKQPYVFDIETTNACNMRCKMCPRSMMTRPIKTMDMKLFENIITQLKPHSGMRWKRWEHFVEETYGIGKNEMSVNHFFLYVIPRAIVLHGYGDPLLDKHMPQRIRMLADKGIDTYFSTNPGSINIPVVEKIFESGLNYLKFSIDAISESRQKEIRGNATNFKKGLEDILTLLRMVEEHSYRTKIVITMIDLDATSKHDYNTLLDIFEGQDVYIYLKGQDQQWLNKNDETEKSIHWSEICQHPWASMSIRAGGEVVACPFDYNDELVLGDAKSEWLKDIWNGISYSVLRENHTKLAKTGDYTCNKTNLPFIWKKCLERCDMKRVADYV